MRIYNKIFFLSLIISFSSYGMRSELRERHLKESKKISLGRIATDPALYVYALNVAAAKFSPMFGYSWPESLAAAGVWVAFFGTVDICCNCCPPMVDDPNEYYPSQMLREYLIEKKKDVIEYAINSISKKTKTE